MCQGCLVPLFGRWLGSFSFSYFFFLENLTLFKENKQQMQQINKTIQHNQTTTINQTVINKTTGTVHNHTARQRAGRQAYWLVNIWAIPLAILSLGHMYTKISSSQQKKTHKPTIQIEKEGQDTKLKLWFLAIPLAIFSTNSAKPQILKK